MPKFYFQFTDGLSTIVDHTGQEFSSAASAREFATASQQAFSDRMANNEGGESWMPWSVQVLDEHGLQVFTLTLPLSGHRG